jgi:hypothetical protein
VIPEYNSKDEEIAPERKEKPVLEIVTKVSTSFNYKGGRRGGRRFNPPPPPPPIGYDDYGFQYNNYDYGDDIDSEEDEPEMKVAKIEKTNMIIHSEHLINALRAVIAYYPHVPLIGKTVTIEAPYRVLVHHREDLIRYKSSQPIYHDHEYAKTTAKHIDVLLDFIYQTMGEQIREEEARYKMSPPMATFDNYWMTLKPGDLMYAKRNDLWTPYVISNVTQAPPQDNTRRAAYQINCWYLECMGQKVARYMAAFYVNPWTGEQAIESLEVIPAAFFPEDLEEQGGVSMLQKQIKLGKLYWELLQRPTYMEYDGLLVNSGPGHLQFRGPSGYMTGRVICDAEGYSRFYALSPEYSRGGRVPLPPPPVGQQPPPPPKDHLPHYLPRCGCKECATQQREDESLYHGFEDLDPTKGTPPNSDIFYAVLSNVIPAFILGDRRWGQLNLEYLKPVVTDKEAFKYLVLDDEIKLTVKALIGKFAAESSGRVAPWANDFVKNKGEGRIFLLHGTPGVGKTCTAECVAELTHRPLISLTSGDLSVNSYNVELNLSYFLQLGQRYGALVLLDEADVYLERRRAKDISRNGLVSVFLRALEYYRGVLFLTTNRVQAFDTAFTSRIHVALHYKNLTDNDRERIWTNNFERLDRDSKGKVHVSVATREYAYESRDVRSLRWNGREIRNALQTAVALAESDAVDEGTPDRITVSDKHLRAVVKMSRGFKDYLRGAHRFEGEESGGEDDVEGADEDSVFLED